MGLIAVPNVSEGRDRAAVERFVAAASGAGARVVDLHVDPVHNRSVLTIAGTAEALIGGLTRLACAARTIDLARHVGVHPRLGGLDVCPIVPNGSPLRDAATTARGVGRSIAATCDLPVFLYGAAARRAETRELPDLRRGGLDGLMRRVEGGLAPDLGPRTIDPRVGVVCVGARDVLIAFNVWLRADVDRARAIAAEMRDRPKGVRALGLRIDERTSQVSMNLTRPAEFGVDEAFDAVAARAAEHGISIVATELVGVPPARYLPDPRREAARLLKEPGRSLESALS